MTETNGCADWHLYQIPLRSWRGYSLIMLRYIGRYMLVFNNIYENLPRFGNSGRFSDMKLSFSWISTFVPENPVKITKSSILAIPRYMWTLEILYNTTLFIIFCNTTKISGHWTDFDGILYNITRLEKCSKETSKERP